MKKYIFILLYWLILAFITPLANALDLCEDTPEITPDCIMVTPELTQCTTYDYKIFDTNGTIKETGNLTALEGDVYHFNFTLGAGEYIIRLCDGATREVVVEADKDQRYYLYVVALITSAILIGLGYYLEEETFPTLAGMLSIMIAINLYINGFPNLTNDFLKHSIIIVLVGIGFLFMLMPNIELIESWRGKMFNVD